MIKQSYRRAREYSLAILREKGASPGRSRGGGVERRVSDG